MINIVLQLQKSSDSLEFNHDSREGAEMLIKWAWLSHDLKESQD